MIGDERKKEIYEAMVRYAFSTGTDHDDENVEEMMRSMLLRLRDVLGVSHDVHCEVVKRVILNAGLPVTGGASGRAGEKGRSAAGIKGKNLLSDWNEFVVEFDGEMFRKEESGSPEDLFDKEYSSATSSTYDIAGSSSPSVVLMGLGRAGINIVDQTLEGVDREIKAFGVDTDLQELRRSDLPDNIYMGGGVTGRIGTEGEIRLGATAGVKNAHRLKPIFKEADVVFLVFGMGGGTGSGAGPVIAEVASKEDCRVISIITTPFREEGMEKKRNAQKGMNKLKEHADKIVAIPNDFLSSLDPEMPLIKGFQIMDKILAKVISRIFLLITKHTDEVSNFFAKGNILTLFFGHGKNLDKCWEGIVREMGGLDDRLEREEVLVLTLFDDSVGRINYDTFKDRVRDDLSPEKLVFVKDKGSAAAKISRGTLEVMALLGPYESD